MLKIKRNNKQNKKRSYNEIDSDEHILAVCINQGCWKPCYTIKWEGDNYNNYRPNITNTQECSSCLNKYRNHFITVGKKYSSAVFRGSNSVDNWESIRQNSNNVPGGQDILNMLIKYLSDENNIIRAIKNWRSKSVNKDSDELEELTFPKIKSSPLEYAGRDELKDLLLQRLKRNSITNAELVQSRNKQLYCQNIEDNRFLFLNKYFRFNNDENNYQKKRLIYRLVTWEFTNINVENLIDLIMCLKTKYILNLPKSDEELHFLLDIFAKPFNEMRKLRDIKTLNQEMDEDMINNLQNYETLENDRADKLWAINYKEGIIYPFECCSTNLSYWHNIKPELRTLEEDHIEGTHCFNIKENIQTLCRNCHTLKTRYCGDITTPSYEGPFINFEEDYENATEIVNMIDDIIVTLEAEKGDGYESWNYITAEIVNNLTNVAKLKMEDYQKNNN